MPPAPKRPPFRRRDGGAIARLAFAPTARSSTRRRASSTTFARRRRSPRSASSTSAAGPRRARRRSGIEDLRAIPWVFSWSQCRLMLPGWYGVRHRGRRSGSPRGTGTLEELRAMHSRWPFFRSVLSNMDMVLAKTDLAIGVALRGAGGRCGARASAIFARIAAEWQRTRKLLAAITGRAELLADNPTLARIHPQPLSLPRSAQPPAGRAAEAASRRRERRAHQARNPLTINGVAAGLRNSG